MDRQLVARACTPLAARIAGLGMTQISQTAVFVPQTNEGEPV